MSPGVSTEDAVTPETLKRAIDDGESVALLDVRATSEFEEWHLDGPSVEVSNVPYFDFLDGGTDDLLAQVPDGEPVVVVCAKGDSSDMVAEQLRDAGVSAVNLERGMEGWARVYEYRELEAAGDVTVAQYHRPSSGCLSYLVVDGREALVVDPLRAFADEYVRDARAMGAELVYAADTHVHADHVSGVRAVADATDATPVVPQRASGRGIDYERAYETVNDDDTLVVGETTVNVIHTPGHTSGMTSYRVADVLLTGDGLFLESVARPDLEAGAEHARERARTLHESLQSLLELPDDTLVAPGHVSDAVDAREDGTYARHLGSVADEIDVLERDKAAFAQLVAEDMPPRPANHEEIVATNLGEQSVDDEEAFRLELGPNNCAASDGSLTEADD